MCDAHKSQGYLKLAGWPNTAWIRRGMPEKKTSEIFPACVYTPWIRPVIHNYNTLYIYSITGHVTSL